MPAMQVAGCRGPLLPTIIKLFEEAVNAKVWGDEW